MHSDSSPVNYIASPFNVDSPSHHELSLMKRPPCEAENPRPADLLKLVSAISTFSILGLQSVQALAILVAANI